MIAISGDSRECFAVQCLRFKRNPKFRFEIQSFLPEFSWAFCAVGGPTTLSCHVFPDLSENCLLLYLYTFKQFF